MITLFSFISLIAFAINIFGLSPVLAEPICYSCCHSKRAASNLPANLKLRIMPLGDSITFGIGSSKMSSYRADLYNKLTAAGAKVDMIGSQKSGSFPQPNHEGWSGYTISQISSMADRSIKGKPNLILLMAGGNDILWAGNKPTAPDRLGSLIDKLTNEVPEAVVLVATQTTLPRVSKDVDTYNSQIPKIVSVRAGQGKKVAVVSMAAVKASDLKDGVHPNDAGYTKMADAWYKAIEEVAAKGWIKDPA